MQYSIMMNLVVATKHFVLVLTAFHRELFCSRVALVHGISLSISNMHQIVQVFLLKNCLSGKNASKEEVTVDSGYL